jgi:hypothetical protein
MPVRSSAPIALRYSASIRAWAHTKLIRQIVLTVTGTESKSSNAASFVMPAAANQPQAPSSRSFGAVHHDHERSEFGRMQAGRMQASRRPKLELRQQRQFPQVSSCTMRLSDFGVVPVQTAVRSRLIVNSIPPPGSSRQCSTSLM